jgi:hypothetical protein
MQIAKGDIVLHKLSLLYFICENSKQARWMNMNAYYELASRDSVPESYFAKD